MSGGQSAGDQAGSAIKGVRLAELLASSCLHAWAAGYYAALRFHGRDAQALRIRPYPAARADGRPQAFQALHGTGEAIRGTINDTLDGTGDAVAGREQGSVASRDGSSSSSDHGHGGNVCVCSGSMS